ncbi:serine hydrolase domain-containing protein [Paenibacillus camelliae]|uniref:serine hydrolase domain-containing protein n=1 Tax=Paenibacillus camelliae TaxID=512410 RepID=UPI00203A70D5|nr:serine hydrolase domain-containing protein [Paenibacillus camelliae]MCM3634478.1 beta-lactamase family protein [Paenibacillus camelliae]
MLQAMYDGNLNAKPEDVGYDRKKLEALNEHYEKLIERGTLQGASYLISKNGHIFARSAMGKLRYASDSQDLLPQSIRKVYSITKAFTAVAIGQLIDRGLLYLHQSASSILPEMDNDKHRQITIFHLLTHTSGLNGDPGFYNEPYGLPWFEWTAEEIRKQDPSINWKKVILAGPLQRMPGKEWIYSTSAYALLGAIIAAVSGKSYEQYIYDEILQPLGMSRTFFTVPEAMHDEVCVTSSWQEEELSRSNLASDDDPPKAGNGLYSTLDDLWIFGQMMLNGGQYNGKRILSPRAIQLQTTNHLHNVPHQGWGSNHKNYPYGLGWSLEHYDLCSKGTYSHEGFGHSGLYIDPVEQLVFVFFVPSQQGYTHESVLLPRSIVWSGIL